MQIYFVIALVFSLLVAIFAIQNSTPVDIKFLVWEVEKISQVLVILGAAAIGALIVLSMSLGKQIRLIIQIRQLTQYVAQLRDEKQKLKQQLDTTSITKLGEPEPAEKEKEPSQKSESSDNNKVQSLIYNLKRPHHSKVL